MTVTRFGTMARIVLDNLQFEICRRTINSNFEVPSDECPEVWNPVSASRTLNFKSVMATLCTFVSLLYTQSAIHFCVLLGKRHGRSPLPPSPPPPCEFNPLPLDKLSLVSSVSDLFTRHLVTSNKNDVGR